MRITVDRKTGHSQFSDKPGMLSENLVVVGKIECLHTESGSNWFPSPIQIESYLDSLSDDKFASKVSSIEGQFLILWRKSNKVYIFCDRYCVLPIYYRFTSGSLEFFDRILDYENNLSISQQSAIAFLLFRYIPGRQTLFNGIFRIMPGECLILHTDTQEVQICVSNVYPQVEIQVESDNTAAETFHALFRKALELRLRPHFNEKLLLPLSGGLDSRYIIGTALELVAPNRIVAMTFGTPGSYDFEIGKQVAKAAGVQHVSYPLSPKNYHSKSLEANCKDTDGQISFTTEAPIEIYHDFSKYGKVALSGYVGDAVMGNKANPMYSQDKENIAMKNALIKSQDPLAGYISQPIIESSFYYENGEVSRLGASELWFFINHFTKYTTYCVFKLREHFEYINPFIDYAFLDYVLNLPQEMRIDRRLYFYWLQEHFPHLASLPCRAYRGASLMDSPTKKIVAHQWDRFIHYFLRRNKGINKIDLFQHRFKILEPEQLRKQIKGLLPPEVEKVIFGKSQYYFLLYNLKCLSILRYNFGIPLG